MTFEEHLLRCRRADGTYDLQAAERARAKELTETPGEIDRLAAKAAKQERRAWENQETDRLRKLFNQPALSPELELDIKVPLGGSTVIRYGEMDKVRIRLRRDLRLKSHIDENHAFEVEIRHWLETEALLSSSDEKVEEAMQRMGGAA